MAGLQTDGPWQPGDIVDGYVPTRGRRHRLIYLGVAGTVVAFGPVREKTSA